jgi:hypothetical protein
VLAQGPGVERNLPSELPVTVGEERKQSKSSRYVGVSWIKPSSSWSAKLWDPQAKRSRSVGYYASEEDAARAYDCATVQAHGPGAKRNFPAEAISELPVSLGEERKQSNSSRYIGVSCDCGTHRPNAAGTSGATTPRRMQPGRTTAWLCRRADQVPNATSQARPTSSCL